MPAWSRALYGSAAGELADPWYSGNHGFVSRNARFAGLRGVNLLARCGHASIQLDRRYTCMLQKSPRRGSETRERLLDLAESSVLAKGFAATSIEELIAGCGITKSGFFYHFKDKGDLAKALLLRYLQRDEALLDDLFRRADELAEDPLHGFLVMLKLFAEMMCDLPATHPGCLAASFCYQDQLFNHEIRDLNASGLLAWRARFRQRLDRIAALYPPRIAVDLDDLADMAATLIEGGIILSRVLRDPPLLPRQVMLYRDYIRAVFAGT
jgi:TetR/AcrR family transcriptional regulator, transcriptional repressor for nem operon